MNVKTILAVIAILLTVASFAVAYPHLLAVAVLLVAIALIVP